MQAYGCYLPGEPGRTVLLRVRQPGAPWHRLPNLLPQDHGIMDQKKSFIHIMHPRSLIQASGPRFDLREEEKTYPRKKRDPDQTLDKKKRIRIRAKKS